MGKRKRLHIISVSQVQQQPEASSSEASHQQHPAEASSSEASHQQHPAEASSYQNDATTSSEATTDSAQSVSGD